MPETGEPFFPSFMENEFDRHQRFHRLDEEGKFAVKNGAPDSRQERQKLWYGEMALWRMNPQNVFKNNGKQKNVGDHKRTEKTLYMVVVEKITTIYRIFIDDSFLKRDGDKTSQEGGGKGGKFQ